MHFAPCALPRIYALFNRSKMFDIISVINYFYSASYVWPKLYVEYRMLPLGLK